MTSPACPQISDELLHQGERRNGPAGDIVAGPAGPRDHKFCPRQQSLANVCLIYEPRDGHVHSCL